MMDDFSHYDALAGSIDIKDIASDEDNADMLRRIRDNDREFSSVCLCDETVLGDDGDYCPANAHEAGWLGYFVGKSTRIKTLGVACPRLENYDEILEPFCRGISRNKSIERLDLYGIEGGDVFRMLGPLFKHNPKLRSIHADDSNFGAEGCRLLSLALAGCTKKMLTELSLSNCEVRDDQSGDIVVALSMHTNLQSLYLLSNGIGRNGCMALATLLNWSATTLRRLDLRDNNIDDIGMEALMQALTNRRSLEYLNLSTNPTISARGWRALSRALEHPMCSLKILYAQDSNIGDEAAVSLASGLTQNKRLHSMSIGSSDVSHITTMGWAAISNLINNTSSINATFMSNHTLETMLGRHLGMPENVKRCLGFNKCSKHPAVSKILYYHRDIDMQPFFEWDFKVLPLAIDWFAKANSFQLGFEAGIQQRKLSAIYQFIRGMPLLYIESRVRGELAAIESVESEIEREQLKLQQERLRLDMRQQELEQRKRAVKERKRSASLARLRA